ncbi:MAG: hypothetical protein C0514_07885 [Candidatus Puniceispirillum sp.]|nr:hypothetical protein [Candidatus Puniceispirillum sp.]
MVSSFCIYALLMGRVLYKRNFLTLNIFSFATLIAGSMLFAWMPVGVNMWLLLCLVVLGVGMGVAFSSLESSLGRFVPDASATFAASLFLMVSLVGNTLGIVVATMGYTWLLEKSFLPLSKSTYIPMAQLLEKATNLSMGTVPSWAPDLDGAVASISAFALQHMMLVNVAIYTLALVLCAVFMQKEHPMSAPEASPEKVSSRDIH